MTGDIERIEYRWGALETGGKPDDLPVKVWSRAEIPDDIRKAVYEEGILELGGAYGDRDAGYPVEYDHLKLVLADGVVEVEFFNRGITLFMTDDEKLRRIHRVLHKLAAAS